MSVCSENTQEKAKARSKSSSNYQSRDQVQKKPQESTPKARRSRSCSMPRNVQRPLRQRMTPGYVYEPVDPAGPPLSVYHMFQNLAKEAAQNPFAPVGTRRTRQRQMPGSACLWIG